MGSFRKARFPNEQAAALLIALAFVVLLTGLGLAYLTRATSDRAVAQSSFHQSKADELAASAMDLIIGDLQTEIANGSSPTPSPLPTPPMPLPTATPFVYPLLTPAYIVPVQWPTPTPGRTPMPNLIRVSKRNDGPGGGNAVPSPGVPSHASAVNSTNPGDASANGRVVNRARWNKHYLIPRPSPTPATDTSPIPDFSPAPDWVILTRNGPVAFNTWNSALADPTRSNNSYCVGRYAYAIYDEGGLLDANVAGYPPNATASQYGPKGVSAFADLTALGLSTNDIYALVGWRNRFSAGPSGNFPNFNFSANATTNFVNFVLSNTNGFMSVPAPSSTPNNMSSTDQQFTTRQSLIQLLVSSGLPDAATAAYALQYLGTFSRELNGPSWAPTLNATDMGAPNNGTGNIYAYKDNAANPAATPVNPNLLNVRVCSQNGCGFTRADGTQAVPGEPLIKTRFPLTRLAGVTPTGTPAGLAMLNGALVSATAATIQRDFGLQWDSSGTPPNNRWNYVGATGSTIQTRVERLDEVAAENREPNFFEILKAAILNGSVGIGSGSTGNTFVAAESKYWNTADTSHGTSSDYQIMQIGANIINQWDSRNLPIFIGFGQDPLNVGNPYEIAGIKNLPYLNKIVFKPYWKKGSGNTHTFDAWLLPSLWNPHQNAPTHASQNVRVQMTLGSGAIVTAYAQSPNNQSSLNSTEFMIFDASAPTFGPTPSAPTAAPSQKSTNVTASPDGYYGFHFPQQSLATGPDASSSAYPDFGASCTFELQVDVTGNGNWKSYQKWSACAQPATPLMYKNTSNPNEENDKTLQDPEFVVLDPRTVRFGVWGNDANHSGSPLGADYTNGTQYTLDSKLNSPSLPVELITALPPQGASWFTLGNTSPYSLYQYANNNNTGSAAHYIDFDQVQRLGDFPTTGDAIDPANDELQPSLSSVRPLALNGAFQNGVFQSVGELGHVFRDQPWKTLTFTSAMPTASTTKARSADSGLLDVFTLHESSIEAGKTSLNTRQAPVLKAILSKAAFNLTGTSIISPTQIDDGNGHGIVPTLMNLTSSQPMLNKTELVTPNLSVSPSRISLVADASVTALGNKEARECVVRAFSDACQTRTWNLLIDLIAQSGRYPPNANSLGGFVVEGETHYWVHVAIDRFTGQVIDKQIEVVNE